MFFIFLSKTKGSELTFDSLDVFRIREKHHVSAIAHLQEVTLQGATTERAFTKRCCISTNRDHGFRGFTQIDSRCVKRVIDGVTTILTYDQWTAIAEWDGSGNLIATNVYGLGDDEVL